MSDSARAIIWNVAVRRNVRPEDITGPRKFARIVRARADVLKQLAARGYSTPQIGAILDLDHSTVLYHLGRLTDRLPTPEVPRWRKPRIGGLHRVKCLPPPPEPRARRRKRQLEYLVSFAGSEVRRIKPRWARHRNSPPINARS